MFVMYADKNKPAVRRRESVTSGSVSVYTARFEFSPDWEGMERVAVFKAGTVSRSILLDETNTCDVPWEVLKTPGVQLRVGVYGTQGGDVVLPTGWADMGKILEGVSLGGDAHPPTPDLWEQELAQKGGALDYDGLNLSLLSGDKPLSTVQIAGGGGGPAYRFGHGLKQDGLSISVDAVSNFDGDNTLPMTAAGVQASVGNIEALLATI